MKGSKVSFFDVVKCARVGLLTHSAYEKIAFYPVMLPLVYLLINYTSVTANQLTLTGLIVGSLFGVVAFFKGAGWLFLGLLFFGWCDYADGRVALLRGTQGRLGAFLDMVSDRAVLFFYFIVLESRHLLANELWEVFALSAFFVTFLYVDVLCYALLKIDKEKASDTKTSFYEGVDLSFHNVFFRFAMWQPGRSGAMLLMPLVYLFSGSFIVVYVFASACTVFEVVYNFFRMSDRSFYLGR